MTTRNSLKAYETALKLQPDYAEAIEYLAELYVLTGKLDDAKASFTKLRETVTVLCQHLAAVDARLAEGAGQDGNIGHRRAARGIRGLGV